jgi:hypothetical protein
MPPGHKNPVIHLECAGLVVDPQHSFPATAPKKHPALNAGTHDPLGRTKLEPVCEHDQRPAVPESRSYFVDGFIHVLTMWDM